MLRGTDISRYQSSIPAGDFCIMKATEGVSYVDAPFASRWKTLASRGTLRGAYHFARPGNNGPGAEADHFLSVVLVAGLKPGDLLVLDHETAGGSAAHDASWAQAWCTHVQAKTGVKPVVYTFLSFAQDGRCAGLGGYPLWIADPSRPAGQPRVPAPWKDWVLHQYGEPGGVDVDVFKGSRSDWLTLGGQAPTPAPTPVEDDMPYGVVHNGTDKTNPTVQALPEGRYTTIGLNADNGIQGLKPASLRVAMQDGTGKWTVAKNTVVDSAKGQMVLHLPARCVAVSILHEDVTAVLDSTKVDTAGAVNVAYEVS